MTACSPCRETAGIKKSRRLIFARTQFHGHPFLACCEEENGKLCRILPVRTDLADRTGCIYAGQVEKISADTNAAFIRIGAQLRGYLDLKGSDRAIRADGKDDVPGESPLRSGECILVQFRSEAIRGKLPSLSICLDFPGKYLVLTVPGEGTGVSKKLDKEQRTLLRARIDELLKNTDLQGMPVFGLTVRTNAAQASMAQLAEEFEELLQTMLRTVRDGRHRAFGSVVLRPDSGAVRFLIEEPLSDVFDIVTDDASLVCTIEQFLRSGVSGNGQGVRLYSDTLLPLDRLYGIPSLLEEIQKEKVWLKSGAFLVIQQTEAFVSIDVNSGKHTGKQHGGDDGIFEKINQEAAVEIVRQVRLRNLSGIILVDFINMKDPSARERLLDLMRSLTKKDRTRFEALDFTSLQIMELVRQKKSPSLAETLKKLVDEPAEN